VRGIRVWARLVGLQSAVVEDVRAGSEGEVIIMLRPAWRERDRCGVCRRRCGRCSRQLTRGAGELSISRAHSASLRPTRRGSVAVSMVWWSRRSHGPGTPSLST
jgi:hypothetical protein